MLKQAAMEFARAGADLASLEFSALQTRVYHPHILIDPTGELKKIGREIIGNILRICILSDLDSIQPEIQRFGLLLNGNPKVEEIRAAAHHLRFRIIDELQSEYYFQVDREEVRFYEMGALFGDEVAKKFKNASSDIKNAGNCLALQQPTACVFHLMRAMEVAVRVLSKRLGVTIAPQTPWRKMTGDMDTKICAKPDSTDKQKRKKNDWEAARANLHHVGSVWRNNTMHPAASYTRGQARDVFDATRVFMVSLCDL